MKKIILILTSVIVVCGLLTYYYLQNDKKMIYNFACYVTNDSTKLDEVINNYLLCDKNSKAITLIQLEYIRKEYNKSPTNKIKVYSYQKAIEQKIIKETIVTEDYDNVYIIFYNNQLQVPILLNSDSKIISISTINKGEVRFFMRIDKRKS
ncbi:hypothetical protein AB3G33_02580 [Flavobacterium sp. WC2421]|uniref:hypothetical protein n=1 Tax=Flavobacterium sp. WC2421 TaxID=3234138 RepID=UPI0034658EEF